MSNYLEESKADGGVAPSTELMQSAIQQAQRLLTRVWDLVMSLLDRCPSPSPQVCSDLLRMLRMPAVLILFVQPLFSDHIIATALISSHCDNCVQA